MNPTQKSNSKIIVTILTSVALVASGILVLVSATLLPTPDGPIITKQQSR